MNTGFGGSNNMFVSALAVVAVILGGAGLYFGLSARNLETQLNNRAANLEQRVEGMAQDTERVGGQVRGLVDQTGRALQVLDSKIEAIAARTMRPTNAVPDRVGGTRPEQLTGPGGVHVVKSGDNLDKIARKCGVSVSALQKANPGVDSRHLKVGQKLKIPGGSSAPAAAPIAP